MPPLNDYEEHKARVIVVPPSTVERAPGAQVKTDGLDAGSLALKYEKGLLNRRATPGAADDRPRVMSTTRTKEADEAASGTGRT